MIGTQQQPPKFNIFDVFRNKPIDTGIKIGIGTQGTVPATSIKLPGMTQDNVMTNQLVSQGKLPQSQLEIYPQQPTKPPTGRGPTNLFINEKQALEAMKNDGIDEQTAIQAIKEKRQEKLGQVSQNEAKALIAMANDGVDINEAIQAIKEKRNEDLPAWKKALKFPFDASVGALGMVSEQVGNVAGFLGAEGMQQTGQELRQIGQRITGDSLGAKTGEFITGAGEILATGPAKVAPTLAGRIWQGALVGGVTGAGMPILEKGNETTAGDIVQGGLIGGTVGAVATPVLEKAVIPAVGKVIQKGIKYGKATTQGGLQGLGKSISRDITKPKTLIQGNIQTRADRLSTNINRMTAGQIRKFNEEIGVSPGKFLNDRGITETGEDLVVKLGDNLKKSRQQADLGLESIQGTFKAPKQKIATPKIDKKTGKFITKEIDPIETMLKDNLENASSKGMSKESLRAKELLEKYRTNGLSMTEINESKRFLNANNKFSYFSDDVSPRKGFVTNLDNEVRKWQFETAKQQGFGNLKEINKQTKAYYQLFEGISGWQEKIAGNNPVGLSDWLAFNADPSLFLTKQIVQSGVFKKGILKGLNKLSGRTIQKEVKPALLSKP